MQKHLQHETKKLNDIFIQNINRSTESTKKQMKAGQEEAKKETADVKKDVAEIMRDVAEMKTSQEDQKVQINKIILILDTVYKD